MKNLNLLLLLISLILVIVISGLFGLIFSSNQSKKNKTEGFCGTKPRTYFPIIESDSINLAIGKRLFKENCASCHSKNMKDDLTGPALEGAILRFNQDTTKFANYIHNQELYLKTSYDQRVLSIHKNFGQIKKPKYEELNMNEIKSIITYIEAIYY